EQPYYVRPHYVFNSGIGWSLPHWRAGNVYHEDARGNPFYDFTLVDRAYHAIVQAGLKPLVELAFTPRALVPDDAEARFKFERSPTRWSPYEAGLWSFPPKDYARWGGLVRALVEHCVQRYGAAHVRGWLWELWNEPDITYWRGTIEQFCALYDVTAAAVKAALPDARVGGPTTTGDLGPGRHGQEFLKGFLDHCERAGTPLDFVSFHTKGGRFDPWRVYGPVGGPAPEKQSPSMMKMLREVRASLATVGGFARFRDLPCIVDECDASVPSHWGLYDNANFAYRNGEYYPVFQCKLMKKLLDLNDASPAKVAQATTWSFYFEGERYFEGTRSLFTAGGIEKPVLNAYRMLSRLGTLRLATASDRSWSLDRLDDGEAGMPEEVDVLAAFNGSDRVSVLVWRHADDQYLTDPAGADVNVALDRLPFEGATARVRHWRIDADHSNSHAAWQAAGAPQDPSEAQLRAIADRQGLELYEADRDEPIADGRLSLTVRLPLPSVSLLEIRAS
ncbi:MAG: glycoside hydrolase, partial [Chloroflexota bacterium]|nr:glycoside hydrolase [Chloroflexota bacterium]